MTLHAGTPLRLRSARPHSGQASPKALALLALVFLGLVTWLLLPIPGRNNRPLTAATPTGSPLANQARPETPLLFPLPTNVSGKKLEPGLWRTASTQSDAAIGREATLAPGLQHTIPTLREGAPVRFPLLDGVVAGGRVNFAQHEVGGWYRVGGSLTQPYPGSFSIGTDGTGVGGLIQFPSRNLAFQIVMDPARGPVLRERRLSDVLCLPLPRPPYEPTPQDTAAISAEAAPPLLSSRPEASAVFYLDFDGETVTDSSWNDGRTIIARAPSLTAQQIQQIWQRVKEDYWPFNIDVTTDVTRYNTAAVRHRMRCIITPTDKASPGAGGVAYVDSFAQAGTGGFSNTIPCWVFNSTVSGVAEAVAHELGHTLGLQHDGRTSPAQEYYAGQGSGATGWAPIMGVGYNKSLVQWSKGEYFNANNKQDDLAIISGTTNGFGYVADEAGETIATAAPLSVSNSHVNQKGIISKSSDVDVYVFASDGGAVDLSANPAPLSPNLDIALELLNESGAVLTSNNPADQLTASLSYTVPSGTYYVRIRGTAKGDPLSSGYSSYGSIGEYTITSPPPPAITSAGFVSARLGTAFTYQIVADNNPTSYGYSGTLPGGLVFNASTGRISGTPTADGLFTITVTASNAYGTGSQELKIDVDPNALDLTSALDQADLTWSTSGSEPWVPDTVFTHDGVDAAKISGLSDRQGAVLQTQVEGPASLRFFWRVSSEQDYDYLSFSVDGEERFRITGETAWQIMTIPIPAGTHQVAFKYQKDAYESGGEDAAWVDEVTVFPREGHSGSDSFAGAQSLTGAHVSITTSNVDATVETQETPPLPATFSHSLWWAWTAPETGSVIVSTKGSAFDTLLAVYTGSALGDLIRVSANDDISRYNHSSQTGFRAEAGKTYFITVAGYANAAGTLRLSLNYVNTGDYVGVLHPDNDADVLGGNVRLRVTRNLSYTGSVSFAGRRYAFRGSLASGADTPSITRSKTLTPLNLDLSTDLANGDNAVSGSATDGTLGYHFIARRRITAKDLPALAAGAYNTLLEADTLGSTVAYGSGYGRAVVTARGDIRFSGAFGDGQRVSQGGVLTTGSIWPCFLAPYRGKLGTLSGDIHFDPVAATNLTGALRWHVENAASSFSDAVTLTGSYFFPPTVQYPSLAVNSGSQNVHLTFAHRNPAANALAPKFTFIPANQFTGLPAGYSLAIDPRNGLMSGYLPDPITGERRTLSGIVIEVENRGGGFFNTIAGRGRVDLEVLP